MLSNSMPFTSVHHHVVFKMQDASSTDTSKTRESHAARTAPPRQTSGKQINSKPSLYSRLNYHTDIILESYSITSGKLRKQRLLPPITPLIRHGIPQLTDPGNIQVLHRGIGAVQIEHGNNALLVRCAPHSEVRNILLQRDGDGWVRHTSDGAGGGLVGVVEGVGDVKAVQGGWGREEV